MAKQPRKLSGLEEFTVSCVIEMRGTVIVHARTQEEANSKFIHKHFKLDDDDTEIEMLRWWVDKSNKRKDKKICPDCDVPMTEFGYIAPGHQCESCGHTVYNETT